MTAADFTSHLAIKQRDNAAIQRDHPFDSQQPPLQRKKPQQGDDFPADLEPLKLQARRELPEDGIEGSLAIPSPMEKRSLDSDEETESTAQQTKKVQRVQSPALQQIPYPHGSWDSENTSPQEPVDLDLQRIIHDGTPPIVPPNFNDDDASSDLDTGLRRWGLVAVHQNDSEEFQHPMDQDISTSDQTTDVESESELINPAPDMNQPHSLSDNQEVVTFDYRNTLGDPLTKREIMSFTLDGIYNQYQTPRQRIEDISWLLSAVNPDIPPLDECTISRRNAQQAGLLVEKYDCCPNSCMSYSLYPDEDQCHHCQHPRWKEIENLRSAPGDSATTNAKKPYAQHMYMPVTHCLRL